MKKDQIIASGKEYAQVLSDIHSNSLNMLQEIDTADLGNMKEIV